MKGKDCGFFKWLDLVQNDSIWAMQRELEDVKFVIEGLTTKCEVLEVQLNEYLNSLEEEKSKRKALKKEKKKLRTDAGMLQLENSMLAEKFMKMENRMEMIWKCVFCYVFLAVLLTSLVGGIGSYGTLILP